MRRKINSELLYSKINNLLSRIITDFGGGCGVEKATTLAWLIGSYNLRGTLDIGVYHGRSFFPQALAHHDFTNGKVWGVDPWRRDLAAEFVDHPMREKIIEFIESTDYQVIFENVEKMRKEMVLEKWSAIVRQTSKEALMDFSKKRIKFDLIHIDGNHGEETVMQDIELSIPILCKKGFIIMDDISWKTVQPAYQYAKSRLSLICEKIDGFNDYAIFRKSNAAISNYLLKHKLKNLFSSLSIIKNNEK